MPGGGSIRPVTRSLDVKFSEHPTRDVKATATGVKPSAVKRAEKIERLALPALCRRPYRRFEGQPGFESRRGIGARRQSIGSDGRIVGRAAEIGRKPAPILDDRLTSSPPDTLFTRPSPYTKPLIIKDL